jgi:acyl carrier protein
VTETEAYAVLTEIFQDVFMRDDIALVAGLTAKDVEGWDSMKQIEIIIAAQERFGIKFTTKELDRMKCVGDLVELMVAKTQEIGGPRS